MHYQCDKCRWSGTWDALILETLCPVCRSGVSPRDPEDDADSPDECGARPGVVPGPPPRC
ncbi:hypothetical protein DND132_2233 [Pseudodesulfovibrio mercurii]|uniref:Uncharacterized protein n=1 Tax=Pseudodesulfovibrio mercurii TaxID=641491 RepID=F0JIK3_9BACT|nr:hypothetical protein DND132_2233 [Pseudodesulfovibrio mercurii]